MHTQEPWMAAPTIAEPGLPAIVMIMRASDKEPGETYRPIMICGNANSDQAQADAARIVGCVNALAGVPTGDLDKLLLEHDTAAKRLAALSLLAEHYMHEAAHKGE